MRCQIGTNVRYHWHRTCGPGRRRGRPGRRSRAPPGAGWLRRAGGSRLRGACLGSAWRGLARTAVGGRTARRGCCAIALHHGGRAPALAGLRPTPRNGTLEGQGEFDISQDGGNGLGIETFLSGIEGEKTVAAIGVDRKALRRHVKVPSTTGCPQPSQERRPGPLRECERAGRR